MNYHELNRLAQEIRFIRRWMPTTHDSRVIEVNVVRTEQDYPIVVETETGVSVVVTAPIGMTDWVGEWILDFDPDQMPTTEQAFWTYLRTHLFVRLDYPEKTIPPPSDPLADQIYIATALRANWTLQPCPYIQGENGK